MHDSGFIHLDLKPANVLITFEGVLKIADFGMATEWPADAGIEGEGDREYIGPEILMGQYDKPADVFALGLIMLEIAGNVELPENGPSWQKLRAGDMSDVPSLTWSSASNVQRDSSGNPVSPSTPSSIYHDGGKSVSVVAKSIFGDQRSPLPPSLSLSASASLSVSASASQKRPDICKASYNNNYNTNTVHIPLYRDGELREPPAFMIDPGNDEALDHLVRWMISPDPLERPVVTQLLDTTGVRWAEARRRAGATVFEGNWGPADDVLIGDAIMTDV